MIIIFLIIILILGLFFCSHHRYNTVRTVPQKLSLIELFNVENKRKIITTKPVFFNYENKKLALIDFFGVLLTKINNEYILRLEFSIINYYSWAPSDNKYNFKIDIYDRKHKVQTLTFSLPIDELKNFACGFKEFKIKKEQFLYLLKVNRIEIMVFPIEWKQYKIHGGNK